MNEVSKNNTGKRKKMLTDHAAQLASIPLCKVVLVSSARAIRELLTFAVLRVVEPELVKILGFWDIRNQGNRSVHRV